MKKLFLLIIGLFVTGCTYDAGYGYYSAYPTQSYYYFPEYNQHIYHYQHSHYAPPPPPIIIKPNQHMKPKWRH